MNLLDFSLTGGAVAADDLDRYRTIDPNHIPDGEVPTHPVIRPDDIWILGRHRVACGDSTNPETVRRALGGAQPILMVTDPPYGVEYSANWRNQAFKASNRAVGSVVNDSRNDWRIAWQLFPGNVAYIWYDGRHASTVQKSIESADFEIRCQIIWVKSRFVIGRGDYHWQHEPCWYAVRKGYPGNWHGNQSQTTVWFIEHIKSDSGHSTQKPIECMQRPIENNTAPGDCVYEPFLGSGTTLMAAEYTGRSCRAIELNPLYVYISIRRWQHHVGIQAVLEATGETFSEVLLRRKNEPEAAEPPSKIIDKVTPVTIVFMTKSTIPQRECGASLSAPVDIFDLLTQEAAPKPTQALIPGSTTLAPRVTGSGKMVSALGATRATVTTAPPVVTLGPRGRQNGSVVFKSATVAATPKSSDPFLVHHARQLTGAGRGRLIFDATDWNHTAKSSVGLDVEVYPNFFLVCFKRFSDGRRLAFELSSRSELDVEGLRGVMKSNTTISFNGINYDLHLIRTALRGASAAELFELSQTIIKRNERPPWETSPGWNHVDLFEVNPSVRMGLKVLHGRLHGRWLVDLPFPPEIALTPEQMNVVTLYCMNDLDATEGLRAALLEPLMMRDELGRRHGLDLMSKSDAQVGEAIVRSRLGGRVGKPDPQYGSFRYAPPDFLKFRGKRLREILSKISQETFTVDPGGKVTRPDWMQNLEVRIGQETYSMGIGGLHSTEGKRALYSDGERFLLDVDASSQYPNIIIGLGAMGLYPAAAGPNFTRVYAEMVKERLEAKASGDRVKADGLKIATNGVFGKLASSYSFLYAPHLFLATTLTGQLSLLMLAEATDAAGAAVVSANTDGLIFHCSRNREGELNEVLAAWEATVGMTLERTRYSAIYSRDVNTYVAVKEDGSTKRKGWIANPWAAGDLRGMMSKNPQMTVLSDAVVAQLTQGVPPEATIDAAADPRAFVTVIQARGEGASWRGTRLGRVVRYYYSTNGDPVVYSDSGRRVAKTEGARPMMELTDRLPNDLDRARYVAEAEELLTELGTGSNLLQGR